MGGDFGQGEGQDAEYSEGHERAIDPDEADADEEKGGDEEDDAAAGNHDVGAGSGEGIGERLAGFRGIKKHLFC